MIIGKLPIGGVKEVRANGKTLLVKRVSPHDYFMQVQGEHRARWGSNLTDVREDVDHFQQTGALPHAKGQSWANPTLTPSSHGPMPSTGIANPGRSPKVDRTKFTLEERAEAYQAGQDAVENSKLIARYEAIYINSERSPGEQTKAFKAAEKARKRVAQQAYDEKLLEIEKTKRRSASYSPWLVRPAPYDRRFQGRSNPGIHHLATLTVLALIGYGLVNKG